MNTKAHQYESMIPAERRQELLKMLQEQEIVTIVELMDKFKVSHMTIRRDLQKLEENGLLTQVTGGAQLFKRILTEPSHLQKELLNSEEKNAIGQDAASLIPPHSCIYLDAGTTSLALCNYITDRSDLTVVSNDFEVINFLVNQNIGDLIHTGGLVQKENRSGIGHLAAQTISSLSFDISFISASSWELRGITTPDRDKVAVKQAVARVSRQRILISDSSKYGQTATYLAVPMSDITCIITDNKLPEHGQKMLGKLDLKVVMV